MQAPTRSRRGRTRSAAGVILPAIATLLAARPDAAAGTYFDARAYLVDAHGEPPQLPGGTETGRDDPDIVPSVALGYTFTPHVAIEARYTSIGDFTIQSESTSPDIDYVSRLNSEVLAVGLPLTWEATDALSLTITPAVHLEFQDREIHASTTDPAVEIIPRVTRPREAWGGGVSLGASFRINQKVELTAEAACLGLEGYDALLLGGGLRIRF